jgi:hypothetical protein
VADTTSSPAPTQSAAPASPAAPQKTPVSPMSNSAVGPSKPQPAASAGKKPVTGVVGMKGAPGGNAPLGATAQVPAFKIESSQNRKKFLKGLFYADYGVGKTFLTATAADVEEMRDVLLINAESGDLTLENDEHDFDLIDSVRCTDYSTIARVYEFLKTHCILRDKGDIEGLRTLEARFRGCEAGDIDRPKMYRTAILDSLTEAEVYCMNKLLGIRDSTKIDEEVASAEWAEYKRQHAMVARLVRNLRDLPMHILFTCARQYVQDEQKKFVYSPAMTGKLSSQVQGFMDVVGYLVTGEATQDGKLPRRLYVQPTGRFAAKCRFSKFKGTYFDNPTIGSILKQVGLQGA